MRLSQFYSQQLGKVSVWTVSRRRPDPHPPSTPEPGQGAGHEVRSPGPQSQGALAAALPSVVHLNLLF